MLTMTLKLTLPNPYYLIP